MKPKKVKIQEVASAVGNLTKANLERAQRIHTAAARSLELPKSLTPKVLKEARFGAEGNENFVLWFAM